MHSPLMNAYKKKFQKSNMGVHLELGHNLRAIIFLFVSWPLISRNNSNEIFFDFLKS
jgi:hypothetical protein